MLTLIGGGLRTSSEAHRPMSDVLPSSCDWVQDAAAEFDPENCQLTTRTGLTVRQQHSTLISISHSAGRLLSRLHCMHSIDAAYCYTSLRGLSVCVPEILFSMLALVGLTLQGEGAV